MNADGSSLRNLSMLPRTGDAIHDYFAYWAPDGATFAFKRIAFDPITHKASAADIYRMNADGTGLLNLTDLPTRAPNFRLSWNPSGTAIAFTLCGSLAIVNCDVYRMAADGTALTELSAVGGGVDAPSWAPGTDFSGPRPARTEIAFSCRDGDGDWEVCVIGADGTGQRQITNNTVPDLVPRWR